MNTLAKKALPATVVCDEVEMSRGAERRAHRLPRVCDRGTSEGPPLGVGARRPNRRASSGGVLAQTDLVVPTCVVSEEDLDRTRTPQMAMEQAPRLRTPLCRYRPRECYWWGY
jgi:hypothetical protein